MIRRASRHLRQCLTGRVSDTFSAATSLKGFNGVRVCLPRCGIHVVVTVGHGVMEPVDVHLMRERGGLVVSQAQFRHSRDRLPEALRHVYVHKGFCVGTTDLAVLSSQPLTPGHFSELARCMDTEGGAAAELDVIFRPAASAIFRGMLGRLQGGDYEVSNAGFPGLSGCSVFDSTTGAFAGLYLARVPGSRGSSLRHRKIARVLRHCRGTATWDTDAEGPDPAVQELDLDQLQWGRYSSKKPTPAAPVEQPAAPVEQPAAPVQEPATPERPPADPVLAAIANLAAEMKETRAEMKETRAEMKAGFLRVDTEMKETRAEMKAGFQVIQDQHDALVARKGCVLDRGRIAELVRHMEDFDAVATRGAYVGRLQGGVHKPVDGAIVHTSAEKGPGLRVHAFDSLLDFGDAAADA